MDLDEPQGVRYLPDFLAVEEERRLLDWVKPIEFQEVVMHGRPAKRTVRHYGYHYNYERWKVEPGEPFPAELGWLTDRAAGFADSRSRPGPPTSSAARRAPPGSTASRRCRGSGTPSRSGR